MCFIHNKVQAHINSLQTSHCMCTDATAFNFHRQQDTLLSYTSCGRLRNMLGRGDIMLWVVVEVCSAEDWWPAAVDRELPSTTYADCTVRLAGSTATTTCATFPDVFSNAEECWLTTTRNSTTIIVLREKSKVFKMWIWQKNQCELAGRIR